MKFVYFFILTVAIFLCDSATSAKIFSKLTQTANVHYHVWFEPNMAESNGVPERVQVDTVEETTFFDVMNLADDINDAYRFEYITYPFGHYITAIGGRSEDPANNIYWTIYKLQAHPVVDSPPGDEFISDVGVDAISVVDEDIYLFWRKEAQFNAHIKKSLEK